MVKWHEYVDGVEKDVEDTIDGCILRQRNSAQQKIGFDPYDNDDQALNDFLNEKWTDIDRIP